MANDLMSKAIAPGQMTNGRGSTSRRRAFVELTLDAEQRRASLDGRSVRLTRTEFRLLLTLASMPSRTFTRAELIRSVYADHRVVCERTIDSHVKTLRRKLLRVHPAAAVRAIYGGGYRAEVGLTATVATAQ